MKSHKTPNWTQRLFETVFSCWSYHTPCKCINFQAWKDDELNVWQIKAAPVFQELYGGEDDGKKIWSGFLFDMGNFSKQPGVWIQEQAITSVCAECSNYPKLIAKGRFENHEIMLEVFLEPIVETEVKEIINTITNEIQENINSDNEEEDDGPPLEPLEE